MPLWYYFIMGLILVGLIGLFIFLRKQGEDDD